MRELNFKDIICLQSHGQCLSRARACVLVHTAQPAPTCCSTWECTMVLTDIVNSVFMTTCRTGRVIPSWLVTMHQSDFLQPYRPLLWSLGLEQGPVLVAVLGADLNPALEELDHWWAVCGGGGVVNRPQPQWQQWGWVLILWGRPGRAAVPFLLVRVEVGLGQDLEHQSERRLDNAAIRNRRKGRGLVWGDQSKGCYLGAMGLWANHFTTWA